jgi:hypothetical protein
MVLIIYTYSLGRNKQKDVNIKKLNEYILERSNHKCEFCSKDVKFKHEFDIDHKIPVMVGGDISSKDNLQILCKKCHRKKTNLDILVINQLKKMKIIQKGVGLDVGSLLNFEELEKLYSQLYILFKKGKEWDIWWDDYDRKDYRIIRKNGEVYQYEQI